MQETSCSSTWATPAIPLPYWALNLELPLTTTSVAGHEPSAPSAVRRPRIHAMASMRGHLRERGELPVAGAAQNAPPSGRAPGEARAVPLTSWFAADEDAERVAAFSRDEAIVAMVHSFLGDFKSRLLEEGKPGRQGEQA